MRAQHVRIARATNRLDDVVAFYRDILGLDVLSTFEDHAGFDGVMLGQPGHAMHFEFTRERGAETIAVPSPEDLVAISGHSGGSFAQSLLGRARHHDRGPDGYRIVLHRGPWNLS